MSPADDNRSKMRPATTSSRVAGAGSALFGIVFASFVISLQVRSGFDLPQMLVGLVGTGLLVLLGVWVLVRPNRLNLILTGSLLLLYGGFILSAVLFSGSKQPFWALPAGMGLIGLSVLSFRESFATPSQPLAPAAAATVDTPPPATPRWFRLHGISWIALALTVASLIWLNIREIGGPTGVTVVYLGWPQVALQSVHVTGNDVISVSTDWDSPVRWGALLIDLLVNLSILFTLGVGCEWWIRNRVTGAPPDSGAEPTL
jgi:hypothetical protein